MKRKLIAFVLATVLCGATRTDACTNVIVTKGASADGSCLVSYAADSHQLYGELYYKPAADWPEGAMLDIYNWDSGLFGGRIPQVRHTYQTVGNMNEHQLIICETTFGGREELANPEAVVGYGSLIYVTLQRAKTAREAIRTIDFLMQNWGYTDEGETFSIADKDECWIMEFVGKGKGRKGGVWVARRVPDGMICAHANCSRITTFPLDDPENCLYSPDVISFAREMGYFDGKDEEFSFRDAYSPLKWDSMRGCESRTWAAFRKLGGKNFDAERYEGFATGHNPEIGEMPLFIKPERKLTVKDIADIMRDHYEGTVLDMREDVGAGAFRAPYRWRPMGFEVDSVSYEFERPIATQQTGFWYVCQSRGWLPDEIGGICWFGVDDAATSALTPIYTTVKKVPECFAEGNGNMMTYSPTSAFWLFNRVTHFAYLFYDRVEPELRKAVDEYENENISLVEETDRLALDMMKAGNGGQVRTLLTEWCCQRSQYLFDTWTTMGEYLLVKYMDGNVKKQNEDGSFTDNGSGAFIPEMPSWPKYRERWLRALVGDHGTVMRVAD
ncbi:MAG: C69 family dipeptidase [Bacteroidales bacterium]|nr:C69 family dipeptidase [Candidatus Cacconaster caballi]